jgi:proline iminopeptidase
LADLYPPIEPYATGMLDAGDGNSVHWETCGTPTGKPAVVLHGGPGSGCTPHHRRFFDPTGYRVVLFDQRGSGRSTPHASEPTTDLAANTTQHLVADIELLREHLGIERWLVFGNSWGSTLALAYAEQYPERVSEIVLVAVTMTRPSEIDWLYHGVGRFFPEEWARFRAGVPARARGGSLVDAYYELLQHGDDAVREQAARDWCAWEDAVVSIVPDSTPNPRYDNPRFRMAFARIVTHYFHHRAWLEDGALLRDAHRLSDIPGVLIHGRLDVGGPLMTAWELSGAWPGSELVVGTAGHSSNDPWMRAAAVDATDAFALRR